MFLFLKYLLEHLSWPKAFKIFWNLDLTSHRLSFLSKKFIFIILLYNFSKFYSFRNRLFLLFLNSFWNFFIYLSFLLIFLIYDLKIIILNYTFILFLDKIFIILVFKIILQFWNLINTFYLNAIKLVFVIIIFYN